MKLVAVVGMVGSGKSEVSRLFKEAGFTRIRFGDVTDDELRKRGQELNEENERRVRELLRQERGMAVYAELNLPRIDAALTSSDVVVDGLYSWEEYTFLKDHYGDSLCLVAVWSSPATRYSRLGSRRNRPLTPKEAAGRDQVEIENLHKGGPIAVADYLIVNESSMEDLRKQTEQTIARIR
ncbi:MAG TPA: AAA family ATPase [Dehalococcoidia bacterium]|nr:AAA family ATPase [Dehalococcoidia bacterium]